MFFDAFDDLHDYLWAAYCKWPPYTLKSNGIEGTYRRVRVTSRFNTNQWALHHDDGIMPTDM